MPNHHRQESIEPNQQQERLPHGHHQRRYPSLWLSCKDPVMDQALASLKGLNPAIIIQTHRVLVGEHLQVNEGVVDLIETAVRNRRIVQIVVCGHAGCSSDLKSLRQRNASGKSCYQKLLSAVRSREEANRLGQRQVLENIRALQQSPFLAWALSRKALTIHGLFYFVESGTFSVFNYQSGQFVPAAF